MLSNQFVTPFERSYQQNKENIRKRMSAYIPEVTDHTESEVMVRLLSNFYGLVEMLGVNGDYSARELWLSEAKLYESFVMIARNYDYRVKGSKSASVSVRFVLSSPALVNVVIPAGTEVRTESNIRFFTKQIATILAGNIDVFVDAVNEFQVLNETIGETTGLKSQTIELVAENIVDNSVTITINSIAWEPVETLAYSTSLDNHYVCSIGKNKLTQIEFGDNLTGLIPSSGFDIIASYKTTDGELGNVSPFTINTIVSSITTPSGITISCENINESSGGTGIESSESLAKRIPLFIRTIDRAVTEQDYIDIAVQSAGVSKAGVDYRCGKEVDVYVSPIGGGIATQTLLDDVLAYFNDGRRMLTTRVRTKAAGEVSLIIQADIRVKKGYSNSILKSTIENRLIEEYNEINQNVKGSVYLSDIYQIIETTDGVENSNINKLSTKPYAFILQGTNVLLWNVTLLPESNSTTKWKIVLINATDFQIFKNGSYVKTGVIGVAQTFVEVEFTINTSSYVVGDQWEFTTYKYFGNVTLEEMSIPVFKVENINLILLGGI